MAKKQDKKIVIDKKQKKEPKQTQANPKNPVGKNPNQSKKNEKKWHKTMSLKKELRRKWSSIQKEISNSWWVSLSRWRPNLFQNPDELLELFNLYLASIQEKKVFTKDIPLETYDRNDPDFMDRVTTHTQWVKLWIDIREIYIFKSTPTKLWFYVFMGWMSSEGRSEYKKKDEFSETVWLIETYLESVVENWGLQWTINPTMAQFVLNTTYGRVPKNINLDKEYIPTDEEKEKMDKLIYKNT